jgi:hypothetical protein
MAFFAAQSSTYGYITGDDVNQCDLVTALCEDTILNGHCEGGPVRGEVDHVSAGPREAQLALNSHSVHTARVVPRVSAEVVHGRAEVGRPADASSRAGLLYRGAIARALHVNADQVAPREGAGRARFHARRVARERRAATAVTAATTVV